jgi:hypothetical protein
MISKTIIKKVAAEKFIEIAHLEELIAVKPKRRRHF